MKNCVFIPRFFIPHEDAAQWVSPSPLRFPANEGFWERVAMRVGGAPSALHVFPPVFSDGKAEAASACQRMYEYLGDDVLEKLARGAILTERRTEAGLRTGLVACLDLEQYGEDGLIRPAMEGDRGETEKLLALRRACPLEFSPVIALYRDKKQRVLRRLQDRSDPLYSFELPEDGGTLTGSFVPDFEAEALFSELHGKTAPAFVIADGGEYVDAAKAHWEALKPSLKEGELRSHPARFVQAELVPAREADLRPLHRLLSGVERDAFADFFCRNVKCRREDGLLFPQISDLLSCVRKTDETIARYLRANGGEVRTVRMPVCGEDEACVVLPAPAGDALFGYAEKGVFPAHSFALGGERDGRYLMEGREISYD